MLASTHIAFLHAAREHLAKMLTTKCVHLAFLHSCKMQNAKCKVLAMGFTGFYGIPMYSMDPKPEAEAYLQSIMGLIESY